jgi:hypothetical protein
LYAAQKDAMNEAAGPSGIAKRTASGSLRTPSLILSGWR